MVDTSQNLLRSAKANLRSEAWNRFVQIYTPLISRWLTRFGIPISEVPDLTQDVLIAAATDIGRFEHNGRKGAFRSWLRSVALNRCRRHWQRRQRNVTAQQFDSVNAQLHELADPKSELTEKWDREHDQYVLQGLFQILEREFDAQSLYVFYQVTIMGKSPIEVAAKNDWSVGRVYKVKFRIMKRLRESGQAFLQ